MKFISKYSNYRVTLRPGIPGNRLAGAAPQPGLYVKFEDGVVEVKDEKECKMMMEYPTFSKDGTGDFILAPEDDTDPYADTRQPTEPEHSLTDIEYGHVGKSTNIKPKKSMTPEQKKELKKMAAEMAKDMVKEMAPVMAKEMVKEVLAKKDILTKATEKVEKGEKGSEDKKGSEVADDAK